MIEVPTGQAVIAYLGWPSDPSLIAQADQHAAQAATLAKSYVRRNGFGQTLMNEAAVEEDIAAVIISSAARSLSNPSSAKEIEAGVFHESPGSFYGWSLVELVILQGYRRMAAG